MTSDAGPAPALQLLRTVRDLTAARDLDAVMRIVGSTAREVTGADGVTFVLREGDACYYADEQAVGPLWKGRRFPLTQCLSGWVMTERQPAVVFDVYADARIPHAVYRETFVRSLALVPVRQADPIGALGAYWAVPHACSPHELAALTSLADSAALALTNVHLFDELREVAARERAARLAAESAAAAKNEFLALVSHELRQPLHASLAALRLMEVRTSREQGTHARGIVERQLTHMNRLVEELVHAARIVAGGIELQPAETDLAAVVRQAADSVQPLMAERRHELRVDVPSHRTVVTADEHRLQQVLMNLLTNAAKYTDPGGRVRLSLATSASQATITVADTGRGIDAAQLPGVFDLFTRGSGDNHGFGVGLAVARKLVEMHGGTITARSDGPGSGCEFLVHLPLPGVASALR